MPDQLRGLDGAARRAGRSLREVVPAALTGDNSDMTGAVPGRAIVAPGKRPDPVVASRGGSRALEHRLIIAIAIAAAVCVLPTAAQARRGFVPPSASTPDVRYGHPHTSIKLDRASTTPAVVAPAHRGREGRHRLRLGRRRRRRWRRTDPDRGPWRGRARHPPPPPVGLRLSNSLARPGRAVSGGPARGSDQGPTTTGAIVTGVVERCSRARRPGSSRRARGRPSPSGTVPGSNVQCGSVLAVAQTPNWKSCGVGWKPRAWSELKPSWPVSTTVKPQPGPGRAEARLGHAERDVARDLVAADVTCPSVAPLAST